MNPEVTMLLNELNHPYRALIEELRKILIDSGNGLEENVKWNGPNYHIKGQDRVTVRVQPKKSFDIIFHTGTKTKTEPKERIIADDFGLLQWKTNDRVILSFKDEIDFSKAKPYLSGLVKQWLEATVANN